jgi:hypothetical protein
VGQPTPNNNKALLSFKISKLQWCARLQPNHPDHTEHSENTNSRNLTRCRRSPSTTVRFREFRENHNFGMTYFWDGFGARGPFAAVLPSKASRGIFPIKNTPAQPPNKTQCDSLFSILEEVSTCNTAKGSLPRAYWLNHPLPRTRKKPKAPTGPSSSKPQSPTADAKRKRFHGQAFSGKTLGAQVPGVILEGRGTCSGLGKPAGEPRTSGIHKREASTYQPQPENCVRKDLFLTLPASGEFSSSCVGGPPQCMMEAICKEARLPLKSKLSPAI